MTFASTLQQLFIEIMVVLLLPYFVKFFLRVQRLILIINLMKFSYYRNTTLSSSIGVILKTFKTYVKKGELP